MINRVILVGRLVADPEVRYTQSGIPYAKFTIAVDRNFKNANGERDTDFIRITAWRKQAELIGQYMKKGRMIGIDGSLQSNKYETPEGEKRTSYEVAIDQFQFLDRGDRAGEGGGNFTPPPPNDSDAPPPPTNAGGMSGAPVDDSDLPF